MQKLICAVLALLLAAGSAAWATEEDLPEDEPDYTQYYRLDGDTLTLLEGVKVLGGYMDDFVWDAEAGEWREEYHPEEEEIFYAEPGLYFYGEETPISYVQWPSTVERLGNESFFMESFSELTLPGSLKKIYDDAFEYCSFGVLRMEATIPYEWFWFYDCSVYAWEVPEDNPVYKSMDGALLSKDGKTLYAYPNARTDAHWDVPAGVETIASCAFRNEYLKTVSLPVGLKTVEDLAFAGCTRLQSVALPLTVTELGRDIFYECVSLELVSLPKGLEVPKDPDEDWAEYYADSDVLYRGDNGDTLSEQSEYAQDSEILTLYDTVRLLGDGEWVPVYERKTDDEPKYYLPRGYLVIGEYANGDRFSIQDLRENRDLGWVDTSAVRPVQNETLFIYDQQDVTWARNAGWTPDSWDVFLYGPFVELYNYDTADEAILFLSDAGMRRAADGPEGDYGIVISDDPYAGIELKSTPEGEAIETVYGGEQVKLLESRDGWTRVFTGFAEGWVPDTQVIIIPKTEEGK